MGRCRHGEGAIGTVLGRGNVPRSDRQTGRQTRIDGQLLAEEARAGGFEGDTTRRKRSAPAEGAGKTTPPRDVFARNRQDDGSELDDDSSLDAHVRAETGTAATSWTRRRAEADDLELSSAWKNRIRARGPWLLSLQAVPDGACCTTSPGDQANAGRGGGWQMLALRLRPALRGVAVSPPGSGAEEVSPRSRRRMPFLGEMSQGGEKVRAPLRQLSCRGRGRKSRDAAKFVKDAHPG